MVDSTLNCHHYYCKAGTNACICMFDCVVTAFRAKLKIASGLLLTAPLEILINVSVMVPGTVSVQSQ